MPAEKTAQPQQEVQQERQLFFHPFTEALKKDSSCINASDINVHVEPSTRQVTVSGLWPASSSSSIAPRAHSSSSSSISGSSSSSSSSSRRNRRPRKAHVRDVDANGNEIILPEDSVSDDEDAHDGSEDGFVKVESAVPAAVTVTKTFTLPEDVDGAQLQADLTDAGFKVFVPVLATNEEFANDIVSLELD